MYYKREEKIPLKPNQYIKELTEEEIEKIQKTYDEYINKKRNNYYNQLFKYQLLKMF